MPKEKVYCYIFHGCRHLVSTHSLLFMWAPLSKGDFGRICFVVLHFLLLKDTDIRAWLMIMEEITFDMRNAKHPIFSFSRDKSSSSFWTGNNIGAFHKGYRIFWSIFWPTYLPISDFLPLKWLFKLSNIRFS